MAAIWAFSLWLASLTGWRALLFSILAGAFLALALPPFFVFPIIFVSFSILLWQLSAATSWRQTFAIGWGFGFGFFVAGLYWIGNAVLVDAARFGWLWPFAATGLPAFLALFIALAAVITNLFVPPGPRYHLLRAIALAATWAAAEWLRSNVLTGFPWNLLGYAWSFSDISIQAFSLVGVMFMSAISVLIGCLPAALMTKSGGLRSLLLAVGIPSVIAGIFIVFGTWRLATTPDPGVHENIRLRIVQPNIPQHLKWKNDMRRQNFSKLLATSVAEEGNYNYLVWPESAAPYFLDNEPARRRDIANILNGTRHLLTGAIRYQADAGRITMLWNSVLVLDPQGQVIDRYDKSHLVPFGEYLPMRTILSRFGLQKLAAGAVDYVPGNSAEPVSITGLPAFRALVCYEVVFPQEVARGSRPAWLLNVTNDAWYGNSTGPRQHFEITRARAVELGVPLVRAANTGISAIFDAFGRVIGKIPLLEQGVLDGNLPKPLVKPTIYAIFGDWPFAGLLGIFVLVAGILRRKIIHR